MKGTESLQEVDNLINFVYAYIFYQTKQEQVKSAVSHKRINFCPALYPAFD